MTDFKLLRVDAPISLRTLFASINQLCLPRRNAKVRDIKHIGAHLSTLVTKYDFGDRRTWRSNRKYRVSSAGR